MVSVPPVPDSYLPLSLSTASSRTMPMYFDKALEDVAVSLVMRRCPRYLWEMLAWWPVAHESWGVQGLRSKWQ